MKQKLTTLLIIFMLGFIPTTSYAGSKTKCPKTVVANKDTITMTFKCAIDANNIDTIKLLQGSVWYETHLYSGSPHKTIYIVTPSGFDTSRNIDGFVYVDTANNSTFSCNTSIPLPVNLISFTSVVVEESIVLHFSTAMEYNADYFYIKKLSPDGHFMEMMGTIPCTNTNKVSNYEFTDHNPKDGTNLYELHQVDFDGTDNNLGAISSNFFTNKVDPFEVITIPYGRYEIIIERYNDRIEKKMQPKLW